MHEEKKVTRITVADENVRCCATRGMHGKKKAKITLADRDVQDLVSVPHVGSCQSTSYSDVTASYTTYSVGDVPFGFSSGRIYRSGAAEMRRSISSRPVSTQGEQFVR